MNFDTFKRMFSTKLRKSFEISNLIVENPVENVKMYVINIL